MPEAAAQTERLPFEAFLDVLISNGFEIGVEQRIRLHRLLADLGPECDPHRLMNILCPVFASSDAQQETFHQLFEHFFPELTPAETGVGVVAPLVLRPRRRKRIWLIVAVNLIWLGVVAYTGWRVVPRKALPAAAQNQSGGGSSQGEQVFPKGSQDAVRSQPAPAVTVKLPAVLLRLAPYLLVLLLALFELTSWLRREAILSRAPQRDPPSKWPLAPDTHHARIYRSTGVLRIARRLRAREPVESDEVDIPGTVSRTVRSLGFLHFAFRLGSKRPEYVVLIERQSSQDHLAALFLELTESLRKEGVLLNAFFYEGDAQVCQSAADSSPLFLDDLCSRFRDRRAMIFGDGREFSNPYATEPSRTIAALRSFRACTLLSPTPPSERTRREQGLYETLGPVLPASLDGLSQLSLAWGGTASPAWTRTAAFSAATIPQLDELRWAERLPAYVAGLRAYLGDPLLRWLCACAVHSQLHWELTLALSAVIPGAECNEANVLRLCRLKWFRLGAMPPALREALARKLDRATEKRVRGVVLDFLGDHPAPKGSFAETAQKSEIAGHEWQLRPAEASRIRESRELTQLLAESSPKALGRVIPRTIREWFFRQGVPAFGLRADLRAALAVASVVLVVIGVLGLSAIPPLRELTQYRKVWSSSDYGKPDSRCSPAHPPRFRTASGYIESGSQYFQDNNYACASEAFALAISLDPARAEAYAGRAASALRAERTAAPMRARQDLETAIRLDPKLSRAYYFLGFFYTRTHEYEKALDLGRKAAELDPADAYPHNVTGIAFEDLKRFDEARREFGEALRLDPKWAAPQNNIGSTYVDQARDDLAIAAFRDAVKIDPYFTLGRINAAMALTRQGKIDEAIAEYTKAVQLNPGARDAHLLRANLYEGKGDYHAALADMNDLIRSSPDADAFVSRGYYYSKLGDDTRAIADFSEAIKLRPDYYLGYYDRAGMYWNLGRKQEAAADYRKVLELAAPDKDKKNAQEKLKDLDSR